MIAVILIGGHLTLSLERSLEARLLILATVVGAVVELVQIAAGSVVFSVVVRRVTSQRDAPLYRAV